MAPYYTDPNITSIVSILTYIDSITGGLFAWGMLIGTWTITFLTLNRFGVLDAFAAANFVTAGLALLLFMMGLVSKTIMWTPVVLAIMSIFLLVFKKVN